MGAFYQRVFGMTTTAVLDKQWVSDYKNEKIHPAGKHWVNDGIVPELLVYQLVHAER